jgi:hypothetical protein
MAELVPAAGVRVGRVLSYDRSRGLGEVSGEGGATYAFHATAIAGGSRMIEVDTPVCFVVVPGRSGQYEARSLVVVGEGPTDASD